MKRFLNALSFVFVIVVLMASAVTIHAQGDKNNGAGKQNCTCSPAVTNKKPKSKKASQSPVTSRLDKLNSGQNKTNEKLDNLNNETRNNGSKQDTTNTLLTDIRDTLKGINPKAISDIASWMFWIIALLVVIAIATIINAIRSRGGNVSVTTMEPTTTTTTATSNVNVDDFLRISKATTENFVQAMEVASSNFANIAQKATEQHMRINEQNVENFIRIFEAKERSNNNPSPKR